MKTFVPFQMIREHQQVSLSPFIRSNNQFALRDLFSACARAFYFWTRR